MRKSFSRREFLLACAPAALGEQKAAGTAVADRLIGTPVESYPFNWGEGVQMMGLVRAGKAWQNSRYLDYVDQWARRYEARDLRQLLNVAPGSSGRRGYCGHWSPAAAILYLYGERPRAGHLRLAEGVAEFIRAEAERSPEGGLGHWLGSHQLWVDTLYMACPLLAGLGRHEDAALQIEVYARHLQDPRSGLFYHMWDWQTRERSAGLWGRGNGWVLMSLAETLEATAAAPRLVSLARSLARGLQAVQDRDGLWHTVLDDPGSYPESSASAMICYALLKLVRLRILPGAYRSTALKAWKALNVQYVKDGLVTGVSAGTSPDGIESYRRMKVGSETWGTGAYLLAAAESLNRTFSP